MPFKSEAQRRYLWANEPEIARDWTDTYGSRIEAALGGIMRLGYLHGGVTHPDGRRGFFTGAQADASAGRGAMSPGTGMQGQGRGLGQDSKGDAIRRQNIINVSKLGAPPGMTTSTGHTPTGPKGFFGKGLDLYNTIRRQNIINVSKLGAPPGMTTSTGHTPQGPKGFFGKVGTGIKDYIMGGGAIGMGIRGLTNIFGTKPTGWESTMGPRQDMGYNPNRVNPFSAPDRGGDGPYIPPQYNWDDLYAQNIVGDEELDIDTSTGNMEDWSQRFRVDDPYRQDQGALDEQIREYISTLYT